MSRRATRTPGNGIETTRKDTVQFAWNDDEETSWGADDWAGGCRRCSYRHQYRASPWLRSD
eukprot:3259248-Lingulodinium_polyedra.AAC.1